MNQSGFAGTGNQLRSWTSLLLVALIIFTTTARAAELPPHRADTNRSRVVAAAPSSLLLDPSFETCPAFSEKPCPSLAIVSSSFAPNGSDRLSCDSVEEKSRRAAMCHNLSQGTRAETTACSVSAESCSSPSSPFAFTDGDWLMNDDADELGDIVVVDIPSTSAWHCYPAICLPSSANSSATGSRSFGLADLKHLLVSPPSADCVWDSGWIREHAPSIVQRPRRRRRRANRWYSGKSVHRPKWSRPSRSRLDAASFALSILIVPALIVLGISLQLLYVAACLFASVDRMCQGVARSRWARIAAAFVVPAVLATPVSASPLPIVVATVQGLSAQHAIGLAVTSGLALVISPPVGMLFTAVVFGYYRWADVVFWWKIFGNNVITMLANPAYRTLRPDTYWELIGEAATMTGVHMGMVNSSRLTPYFHDPRPQPLPQNITVYFPAVKNVTVFCWNCFYCLDMRCHQSFIFTSNETAPSGGNVHHCEMINSTVEAANYTDSYGECLWHNTTGAVGAPRHLAEGLFSVQNVILGGIIHLGLLVGAGWFCYAGIWGTILFLARTIKARIFYLYDQSWLGTKKMRLEEVEQTWLVGVIMALLMGTLGIFGFLGSFIYPQYAKELVVKCFRAMWSLLQNAWLLFWGSKKKNPGGKATIDALNSKLKTGYAEIEDEASALEEVLKKELDEGVDPDVVRDLLRDKQSEVMREALSDREAAGDETAFGFAMRPNGRYYEKGADTDFTLRLCLSDVRQFVDGKADRISARLFNSKGTYSTDSVEFGLLALCLMSPVKRESVAKSQHLLESVQGVVKRRATEKEEKERKRKEEELAEKKKAAEKAVSGEKKVGDLLKKKKPPAAAAAAADTARPATTATAADAAADAPPANGPAATPSPAPAPAPAATAATAAASGDGKPKKNQQRSRTPAGKKQQGGANEEKSRDPPAGSHYCREYLGGLGVYEEDCCSYAAVVFCLVRAIKELRKLGFAVAGKSGVHEFFRRLDSEPETFWQNDGTAAFMSALGAQPGKTSPRDLLNKIAGWPFAVSPRGLILTFGQAVSISSSSDADHSSGPNAAFCILINDSEQSHAYACAPGQGGLHVYDEGDTLIEDVKERFLQEVLWYGLEVNPIAATASAPATSTSPTACSSTAPACDDSAAGIIATILRDVLTDWARFLREQYQQRYEPSFLAAWAAGDQGYNSAVDQQLRTLIGPAGELSVGGLQNLFDQICVNETSEHRVSSFVRVATADDLEPGQLRQLTHVIFRPPTSATGSSDDPEYVLLRWTGGTLYRLGTNAVEEYSGAIPAGALFVCTRPVPDTSSSFPPAAPKASSKPEEGNMCVKVVESPHFPRAVSQVAEILGTWSRSARSLGNFAPFGRLIHAFDTRQDLRLLQILYECYGKMSEKVRDDVPKFFKALFLADKAPMGEERVAQDAAHAEPTIFRPLKYFLRLFYTNNYHVEEIKSNAARFFALLRRPAGGDDYLVYRRRNESRDGAWTCDEAPGTLPCNQRISGLEEDVHILADNRTLRGDRPELLSAPCAASTCKHPNKPISEHSKPKASHPCAQKGCAARAADECIGYNRGMKDFGWFCPKHAQREQGQQERRERQDEAACKRARDELEQACASNHDDLVQQEKDERKKILAEARTTPVSSSPSTTPAATTSSAPSASRAPASARAASTVTPTAPSSATSAHDASTAPTTEERVVSEPSVFRPQDRPATAASSPTHFRDSQGQVPALAAIYTGQHLLDVQLTERGLVNTVLDLVEDALTSSTRLRHQTLLREFVEWLMLHPALASLPLAQLAARFMHEAGAQRRWQWQTLHRNMCCLGGALSSLPLYSNASRGVSLYACPQWRSQLATVKQRMQNIQPKGLTAVMVEEIAEAVHQSPLLWVKVALILQWLSSARVGDILQLRSDEVTLSPGGRVTINFNHGKGVKLRGPYTVATEVDEEWGLLLKEWLRQRQERRHEWMEVQKARTARGITPPPADRFTEALLLFPAQPGLPLNRRGPHLLQALRVANPQLNMRAMRRGSLQAIAASGKVSIEDLALRAGHTNTNTTRRYLNWGAADEKTLQTSAEMAQYLLPPPPGGRPPPPPYDILSGISSTASAASASVNAAFTTAFQEYLPSVLHPAEFRSYFRRENFNHLPLHAKDVACSIQIEKVHQLLTTCSDRVRRNFCYWSRFLHDLRSYQDVVTCTAAQLPKADLTAQDIQLMKDRKLIAEVTDETKVRSGCRVFSHPELAKGRRRPIRWTYMANEVLPGNSEVHPINMARKPDIVRLVHYGTHFAQHDLAAFFDQIGLTEAVAHYYCFRHNGKIYRLTCLPMGLTASVGVASALHEVLLDFPRRSARCEIVIDNVVFVGSREDVLHDSRIYRERCASVGAVLNDLDVPLEDLAVQHGEFCGVVLDLVEKTVCLAKKSVERARLSWSLRNEWTWQGYQSCIGSLFWSWGILDVPMHGNFALLRFLSRTSADLAERHDLWTAPAKVWPTALKDMERWMRILLENKPRKVPVSKEPEWIVATDASRWGWGYVAVNSETHEVRTHGSAWSPYMEHRYGERLGSSVLAEPKGLVNAMCHLLAPDRDSAKKVLVLSDNSATCAAVNRGFSTHALHLNACIGQLKNSFPQYEFEVQHIAGQENPADKPSRNSQLSEQEAAEAAQALLRRAQSPVGDKTVADSTPSE